MYIKVGAYFDNSPINALQVKVDRSSFLSLCRTDAVASQHIIFISLRISLPIALRTCFLVIGSFRHSIAIFLRLPLATAFPKCFRLGVSLYVLTVLYPT